MGPGEGAHAAMAPKQEQRGALLISFLCYDTTTPGLNM
jgi:hypothetical protein